MQPNVDKIPRLCVRVQNTIFKTLNGYTFLNNNMISFMEISSQSLVLGMSTSVS